ncbi:MAG: site-2 protease family protein [Thermoplasmata archaeon]|nr:site-2 protease family protein [Thermoplasmata archaeon]
MDDLSGEIDSVSRIVGKHFPIYETRVSPNIYSFFVRVEETTLEERFDKMRMEMSEQRFVPILTSEDGETVIHVQKRPQVRYKSSMVNLGFLLVTIATTIFAGMIHWGSYEDINPYSLESVAFGTLFFALPLLAILATHEFGHYYMARKHKVAASLPFFIPSFPPLGTFGAVISMRDPIPSRKALLDIGIAGPICGLIVAIPVTAIGLYLTSVGAKPIPTDLGTGGLVFFPPILFQLLEWVIPIPADVLAHPTVFAGWVGLFVTALNLIPAGQLDGGHIARALLGKKATYVSYASLVALFIMGLVYFGWMIIGLLILLLGAQHPPPLNDLTKLDVRRKIIGSFAAIMLLLCFVIVPVDQIPVESDFEFRDFDDPSLEILEYNITIPSNSTDYFEFYVNNTGNTKAEIALEVDINYTMVADGWFTPLYVQMDGDVIEIWENAGVLVLNHSSEINVTMEIVVPDIPPGLFTFSVVGTSEGDFFTVEKELIVNVEVQ